MKIKDKAIILSVLRIKEKSLMVKCFCQNHGILTGYMNTGKKTYSELMLGNICDILYTKRNHNANIGFLKIEKTSHHTGFIIYQKQKLQILVSMISLLNLFLYDNELHTLMYNKTVDIIHNMTEQLLETLLSQYLYWEIFLLQIIGFGLELSFCSVSKTSDNLEYISPKTGHAVAKNIGLPYHDRLFKIPNSLIKNTKYIVVSDLLPTAQITLHFISKACYNLANKSVPRARLSLMEIL